MEPRENKDLLIQELQNQVKLLQELLENQAKIIGFKDLLLYRCQEQINALEYHAKCLFLSADRSN